MKTPQPILPLCEVQSWHWNHWRQQMEDGSVRWKDRKNLIRMSHWHQQIVDGAEFWISCKWLKALRIASQSQLIKCSAPSTICWCQWFQCHNQLLINVNKVIKVMKCWERIGRQLWIGLKEINKLPAMYVAPMNKLHT